MFNIAKGKVNSVFNWFGRFWYLVLPKMLQFPLHDQRTAMAQVNVYLLIGKFMAKLESARCPKINGSDDGILSQFGLCVGMPGNRIVTIPVKIKQDAIKFCLGNRFELGPDLQ